MKIEAGKVALVGVSFGLYRFAASYLYGSGLGASGKTVGFISNLPFVLSMNLTSCAVALAAFALLRMNLFRRNLASPCVATLILLAGTILGKLNLPLGTSFVGIAQGVLCGIGLFMLSVIWLDIFIGQGNASLALLQLVIGTTLYTVAECSASFVPAGLRTVLSGVALTFQRLYPSSYNHSFLIPLCAEPK